MDQQYYHLTNPCTSINMLVVQATPNECTNHVDVYNEECTNHVDVYNEESSKQKHRHPSNVATMARRMIQLCFLLLVFTVSMVSVSPIVAVVIAASRADVARMTNC